MFSFKGVFEKNLMCQYLHIILQILHLLYKYVYYLYNKALRIYIAGQTVKPNWQIFF